MELMLTVTVGNSAVSFALFRADCEASDARPVSIFRIAALPARTADEYAVLLSAMTARLGEAVEIKTAILCSVVPALTDEIRRALQLLFPAATCLTVGAGLRTGLTIRTDTPAELGADLVAMAVGAATLQKPPFLVLNCDAVTTLSAVDAGKDGPAFLGCAILPGPALGAESLKARAAQLSSVSLTSPKAAIGANSGDSVRAGLLLGHAAAVEGLIGRFEQEIGKGSLPVIATGCYAEQTLPHCCHEVKFDTDLAHRGLCRLVELNRQKSGNPRKRY